ncbi:uncharacterized protein [Diadema setosum]|uniref:uncharacterized protein n=1 Tax=Diadema setosum TaxID=31175 RepID=UPI003B3B17D6
MAQDESDEIVILDWVIDYYCYKFWEEFEKDQRAEMLSDDKFISFVDCLLSFAGSKIDQKSERAIFLELLRQLWEAGNVEETPSPLEVAIGHLEELIDQYHKNAVTLDVDWDSLRLAFKKHAVLLLVREGYVSRARGLTDKLWPRKKRKDADKGNKITVQQATPQKHLMLRPHKRGGRAFVTFIIRSGEDRPRGGGEAATWTSSDEEEDDRPSIYRQKLNTPRKRRSLLLDSSPAAQPLAGRGAKRRLST